MRTLLFWQAGFQRVCHVPIGFHECLQTIVAASPDIDVLFYGSLNPRRRLVLEELQKHCTVKALFGVYGSERDAFIARARIQLNIHQFDAQLLEQVRISYLLNNRCFVVSEESVGGPYPEDAVVSAPYGQLVDVCHCYLADHREHAAIAAAGFAWLRQRPMVEYLAITSSDAESKAIVRPRVSLCMIVKNEEAKLPSCLKSVAGLVDEVVVVDTGSTDGTKAVAASLGARVFNFTWVDSFAAARNASLDHATGEWILWLDADDFIDADNCRKLRNSVRRTKRCERRLRLRGTRLPTQSCRRLDANGCTRAALP